MLWGFGAVAYFGYLTEKRKVFPNKPALFFCLMEGLVQVGSPLLGGGGYPQRSIYWKVIDTGWLGASKLCCRILSSLEFFLVVLWDHGKVCNGGKEVEWGIADTDGVLFFSS